MKPIAPNVREAATEVPLAELMAARVAAVGIFEARPVAVVVTAAMAALEADHAGMARAVDPVDRDAMVPEADRADHAAMAQVEVPGGMIAREDPGAMTGAPDATTAEVISGDGGMTAGRAKPCHRAL